MGAKGSLFFFSLKTWRWSETPTAFESLPFKDTAALYDDKIYFCGAMRLFDLLEYDLTLDIMRLIESPYTIPMRSVGMSVVCHHGSKKLIYFGGIESSPGGNCRSDIYTLAVDSFTWKKLQMHGQQPQPRAYHNAVLLGNQMYMFGGINTALHQFNDLWIAHFGSKLLPAWSKPQVSGVLPTRRSQASLNFVHGHLVLFGGYNDDDVLGDLLVFSPRTLEWKDPARSEVDLHGEGPIEATGHRAVTIPTGVLIFTLSHICLLSCDSAA